MCNGFNEGSHCVPTIISVFPPPTHTTVYIKSIELGEWFNLNDMNVSKITEKGVRQMYGSDADSKTSTNAYLLMYRRMDPTTTAVTSSSSTSSTATTETTTTITPSGASSSSSSSTTTPSDSSSSSSQQQVVHEQDDDEIEKAEKAAKARKEEEKARKQKEYEEKLKVYLQQRTGEVPTSIRNEVEDENSKYLQDKRLYQEKLDTLVLRVFYGAEPLIINVLKTKTLAEATVRK